MEIRKTLVRRKGSGRIGKRTQTITLRLSPDEESIIKKRAEEEGVNQSELIRRVLSGYNRDAEFVEIMRRLDQLGTNLDRILSLMKMTHNNTL